MQCYVCGRDTGDVNPLAEIDEDDAVHVEAFHELYHCQGPPEEFDENAMVVVCGECIAEAEVGLDR